MYKIFYRVYHIKLKGIIILDIFKKIVMKIKVELIWYIETISLWF